MNENDYRNVFNSPLKQGDSLAAIAAHIKPGSEVLELGVASGYFSRFLSKERDCTVDGVELSPEMAEEARPWLRKLVIADLEEEELKRHFSAGVYDAIVCADVLEHLRRPEFVLDQLGGLLKPEGKVFISVPNIAYAGIVLDLLEGNFEYRDEGLLDSTHLHFYTRKSILELLESLSYSVESVEAVRLPFEQSEFFEKMDHHPLPLKNYFFSRPDGDVYQYVIAASSREDRGTEKSADVTGREPGAAESAEAAEAVSSTVDVVIPVAGERERTFRCLESVLACRQEAPVEIIVIDDGCREKEVIEYLDDLEAEGKITLLRNEVAAGLTDCANLGLLLHTDRDAVLLDNGTVVHGNWLDRLRDCLGHGEHIGTVSPFSNAGAVTAYPRQCRNNPPVNDESSLEMIDDAFAGQNAGEHLAIPFASGPCTLITRSCLNRVGYLDSLHFSDGIYVREDLSLRANEAGYLHVLCGDVYVTGDEGTGDGGGKDSAGKMLEKRYHHYKPLLWRHCQSDPERFLRCRVDIIRMEHLIKRSILFIGNRDPRVEKHMRDLAGILEPDIDVLLLQPDGEGGVRIEWGRSAENFSAYFAFPAAGDDLLDFLRACAVGRVHIHHTGGLPEDVLRLPSRLGVPYDVTIHDFHMVCSRPRLTSLGEVYCGEPDEEGCNACLAGHNESVSMNISDLRRYYGEILDGADRVIAPSRDAARRLKNYYPGANYKYLPHPEAEPSRAAAPKISGGDYVKVLVPGELSLVEGAGLLQACAEDAARRNLPLFFRALGRPRGSRKQEPDIPLVFTGVYDEDRLPELIARERPDIIFFPARWPQAFSYSLSAAIDSSLPIAACELGIFPERLEGYNKAFLSGPDTGPLEWNDLFMSIVGRST